jgi:hypothetical protein
VSLARAWTRQLFGASGAALLVPGTVACALAVLAFAGGFQRLGSIGQALSGPAAPPAVRSTSAASDSRAAAKLRVALAAVVGPAPARLVGAAARGGSAAVTGSGAAGGVSGSGGSGRSGGSGGRGNGGSGGRGGSGGSGSGGSGRGGSGGQTVGGGGTAPPSGSVLDRVVSVGTSVTSKVPGRAGTLATQTLQSLGSAVDRILPLGPLVSARATTPFALLGPPRR